MKNPVLIDNQNARILSDGQIFKEFEFKDILGKGEVTTPEDSFLSDYFLVAITSKIWNTIPMDAEGIDQLVEDFQKRLNVKLVMGLANAIGYKSRLLYTKELNVNF